MILSIVNKFWIFIILIVCLMSKIFTSYKFIYFAKKINFSLYIDIRKIVMKHVKRKESLKI